jgi:diacylglycerol O-acyltransferase
MVFSPERADPGGAVTPGARQRHPLLDSVEPGPRSRWWIEVAAIVWLCWVYDAVTNLTPLRNVAARDHALSVLHLEQRLHLDPELTLNHWLAAHHTLGLWASDYYDNAHFVVTLAVVGWLWWRYPRSYRPLRNGLVLTNVIGFVIFWRYPMAPPRMLPGNRYKDIVSLTGAFGSAHSGTLATVANELAAMPSLHIAWAGWSAWAVFKVWRHRRGIWLVWAYPALTAVVVLSTGHHFLADVVAGAATAAVSIWLGARLASWWAGRGRRPGAASPGQPALQP